MASGMRYPDLEGTRRRFYGRSILTITLVVIGLCLTSPDPVPAAVCNPGDGTLPSGWTDADIGTATGGCASYDAGTGTFTVKGAGGGTWLTTADGFHFASFFSTAMGLGDFEFIAKLESVAGPNESYAGLMIRTSTGASARFAQVLQGPGDAGVKVSAFLRLYDGERSKTGNNRLVGSIPGFQKIVRYKDQISLFSSFDGATWTWIDGLALNSLANDVRVGLMVTSQGSGLATAVFKQVSYPTLTRPYETSWLGNSLPGGGSHIQQDISAMYLDPGPNLNPLTGLMESAVRLYTNVFWDEGGAEAAVYTPEGAFERNLDNTHGVLGGGYAITASGSYVYTAMTVNQDTGTCTHGSYGVRRYLKNGIVAPWTAMGGTVCATNEDNTPGVGSIFPISTAGHLRGLAINRRSASSYFNRLYVSDTAAGKIRIYQDSATALTWIKDVNVARPRAIAIDPTDDWFWVIQADDPNVPGNNSAVLHFKPNGIQRLADTITSGTNFQVPVALTVAPDGKVWVTDDGPSQQVKIFNSNGTPASPASFGASGGIYSTAGGSLPGEVRPTKFNGLTGIGLDFSNNNNKLIYLAGDGPDNRSLGVNGQREQGTGTELRKLSYPSGTQIWEKLGLEFIDAADADPQADGLDLFTKETHYVMNYAQPPGLQATYKGVTLDRWTYPNDMRLHQDLSMASGVMIRRVGGTRVMYVVGYMGGPVGVYRFTADSEFAIPCGLLMTERKRGHCNLNPAQLCYNDGWCEAIPGDTCGLPDYCANNPTQVCNVDSDCATGACVSTWPPIPLTVDHAKRLIWNDVNGNGQMDLSSGSEFEEETPDVSDIYGWYVDDNGDIWASAYTSQPAIKKYIAQAGANGCPAYHATNSITYPKPAEFGPPGASDRAVMRAVYLPASDTMFLGGYTTAHPKPAGGLEFGMAGREIIRYNNWQWNHDHASPQTAVWNITDLPYGDAPTYYHAAKGIDLAGSLLFVAIADTAEVRAYDICDGVVRYSFKPGPEVAGKTGLLDTVVPMNAFKRTNGETLVFTEDDGQAKNIMYRLTIPNQCSACYCGGLCQTSYCTGVELGCTLVNNCSYPCGCCGYACNQYLPQCTGPETPPPNACF